MKSTPKTRTNFSTVDARKKFSELVNRAAFGKERIAVSRNKKEIAAVVPIEDVQLLESLEDKLDLEEARLALSDTSKKGTTAWKELKKQLGI